MNRGLIDQIAGHEARDLREEIGETSKAVIEYRIDLISLAYREAIRRRMREIMVGD
jgi:hypothetical protein